MLDCRLVAMVAPEISNGQRNLETSAPKMWIRCSVGVKVYFCDTVSYVCATFSLKIEYISTLATDLLK